MTTQARGPVGDTAPPSVSSAAGPTDSRGSGGSPAGQPAPGVAHSHTPPPAAGQDHRHDPRPNRGLTLTTKGWIAAICASAEPFVCPDRAP